MSKRKINLLGGIFSLLLSLVLISSVAAQSFDPVFEWIKRFQNGEEIELKVYVDTDSFTFFRRQQTDIDQSTFSRLCGETPAQQIKILPDELNRKVEGLAIKYEFNELLRLEETWKGNNPCAWKKIEFLKIASYPLDSWSEFIKQAVSQGLLEYELIEYEGKMWTSLTFKQTGPQNFQFGKRSLKFSDEFYEYMKISSEFKPRSGNIDKLVILVHEPHWLLAGQYQLIPGLKSFLEANSKYKFRFLVEGYWEEDIKYIPTKPILNRFSKDVSTASQVFSLLRDFRIDGPLAYRLLYNPDLPALAIDDPDIIKKTPPEPDWKDSFEYQEVFTKIFKKLEKLPKEQRTEVSQILVFLSYCVMADAQNLKGEVAIDWYKQLAELYDAISNQLSILDFKTESSFLSNQAESCRTEVAILQCALERDVVMAGNIANHFDEQSMADKIPIAFIGNFHTPGLINRLPEGISYVVIEPQVSPLFVTPPKKDRDKFNDHLKIPLGNLKLRVAPLTRELPDYESFLKRETLKIIARKNTFEASSPLSSDVTSMINDTFKQNGILDGAQIDFAADGQSPPPPFQGAFASFFYDSGGENPKLILYDREEGNWKHPCRINFLKKILLILPYEKFQRETKKARFYPDRENNRTFFWLYDSQNQIFYLYEWEEGMNIFLLLPLPRSKDEIHLRISIRELMYYEEGKLHG